MLDYLLSNEVTHRCIRFEKGEECIKNLDLSPDLIILDYMLPGINGLETYRTIKKRSPKVPVIVLTGHYDKKTAQQFLDEGVYDYLLKEENAVNRVRTMVEKVIDKTEEEAGMELRRIKQKKMIRTALTILFILAALAGVKWMLSQ
jgi:DNA-binding NtrC family response regulator